MATPKDRQLKALGLTKTTGDRWVVATGVDPRQYTGVLLEGLIELNQVWPTGHTARALCDRIVATVNRKDCQRLLLVCHDGADGPCVAWAVLQRWEGLMGEFKACIGPVWVRRGLHGEPLAAMKPVASKWAAAVGCAGYITFSVRYDKQNKLTASQRAYNRWLKPFGLRETAVQYEGAL